MSLYRDEHGGEKATSPVSPVMTEIVGGALDAYYLRIRDMETDVDWLRSRESHLEVQVGLLESKVEEFNSSRDEQAKRADTAEAKTRVLQVQLNSKATEIATRDKAIEQYAAWRTAVREALKDLPSAVDTAILVETGPRTAGDIMGVLQRIMDLTREIEGEK